MIFSYLYLLKHTDTKNIVFCFPRKSPAKINAYLGEFFASWKISCHSGGIFQLSENQSFGVFFTLKIILKILIENLFFLGFAGKNFLFFSGFKKIYAKPKGNVDWAI